MEVSRSPKAVIATVRGIGVAVITSRCGVVAALPRSASRCSTPNRCCSSTTTSPRSASLDLLAEQGVGADDDAGLARGGGGERLAPGGGALGAGQQRDPGGVLGAAEQAGLGERAEQGGDGAVVLLGQDLGGREQGGLPAGVDDLEHRQQRHHRLAGADLALQQPHHRHRLGDLLGQHRPDLPLPGGQGERQPVQQRLPDAARAGRAGDGDLGAGDRPALGERGLQHERLLVPQPVLGALPLPVAVRAVQQAERLVQAGQAVGRAVGGGQRVGHVLRAEPGRGRRRRTP